MEIREIIESKLNEIEEKEHVKILHCVESGSRAWGFASPDSDYDVRFIYVREKNWYLDLNPGRDVIEWQLDDVLDINGWDLQKTLKLLHNSNPTVFEWDKSPIVYRTTPEWKRISVILPEYFSPAKMIHHYLGTALGQFNKYLVDDEVRLKKYFYALRPILACEWVADRETPPPMLFDELKEAYLPEKYVQAVNGLVELKKSTPEIGTGKRIELLDEYLNERMEFFKEFSHSIKNEGVASWEKLNAIFVDNVL